MACWLNLVLWASCFTAIVCANTVNDASIAVGDNNTQVAGNVTSKKPFVWASLGDFWTVSTLNSRVYCP
jgi:hypothetical protein